MDKKMSLMARGQDHGRPAHFAGCNRRDKPAACSCFQNYDRHRSLVLVAVVLAVVGFSFNLIAGFSILSAHKKGQLQRVGCMHCSSTRCIPSSSCSPCRVCSCCSIRGLLC